MEQFLNDQLQLSRHDGRIMSNHERVILFPISSFGVLRKELMHNIGPERVKGFLIRYGWDLGSRDAKQMMQMKIESLEDLMRSGPVLHMLKGHVTVVTDHIFADYNSDGSIRTVQMEGKWYDSYEVEEYIKLYGLANEGVCHTLVGYASGYLSTICNQKIIVKELSCQGTGQPYCRWIGKTIADWGEEIKSELSFFDESSIAQELEETYEKLLEERNNLAKTLTIHKKLTEEILQGNTLSSISDIVYETTKIPIIISDLNVQPFAYSGVTDDEYATIAEQLPQLIHSSPSKSPFKSTNHLSLTDLHLLITPIFLQKKLYGYCIFIYHDHHTAVSEIDRMVLERVSSVCSLYLLNEKTSFEAEQRIRGHFLEEILSQKFTVKQEIMKRGLYLNIDLSKEFHIIILSHRQKHTQIKNDLLVHETLIVEIQRYFSDNEQQMLIGQRETNIVIYMQQNGKNTTEMEQNLRKFQTYLAKMFVDIHFEMGLSSRGTNIEEANSYYEEAKMAVRLATVQHPVVAFDSLGVVGVLINSENESALKSISMKLLGNLYKNKDSKNQELIRTLYAYLSNGGNLEQTAQELMLSISGLRYRLQKIEESLQQELRNPMANYQLFLVIQSLILMGEIKI